MHSVSERAVIGDEPVDGLRRSIRSSSTVSSATRRTARKPESKRGVYGGSMVAELLTSKAAARHW